MILAKQLSSLPTNKLLVGGGLGPIATAAWVEIMSTYAPALAGPGMSALVGAAIAFAVGYFVPDRVNLPAV